jgi:excisionase family DNA binding protein
VKRQKQQSVGEPQAAGVVALTKAQMAAALQVCPRTVTEMMRRGEIAYFKIGRRLVRFRIEDALKRMNETVLVVAEGGDQ